LICLLVSPINSLSQKKLTCDPITGTMVPVMGTIGGGQQKEISAALFGKTRRAVLALLFSNPERSYYLREIIRELDVGRGAVQRELENLTAAGIVIRSITGNQVHFQANSESPVFPELKALIVKTAGVAEVLREAILPLSSRIEVAFVYGSAAAGNLRADSDVDLLVVGDVAFKELVRELEDAQLTLGRDVSPTVYTAEEFKIKVRSGQHFLTGVMSGPKIFLAGDESELSRLVE